MNDLKDFNDSGFYQSGRWTEHEHELFLMGLKLYGRNWKLIQCLIKTRSSTQVRTHAQKFFSRDKYPATKRGRYASRLKDIDSPELAQWLKSEESVKRSKRRGNSNKGQYPPESPLNFKSLMIKVETCDACEPCDPCETCEERGLFHTLPIKIQKQTNPFSCHGNTITQGGGTSGTGSGAGTTPITPTTPTTTTTTTTTKDSLMKTSISYTPSTSTITTTTTKSSNNTRIASSTTTNCTTTTCTTTIITTTMNPEHHHHSLLSNQTEEEQYHQQQHQHRHQHHNHDSLLSNQNEEEHHQQHSLLSNQAEEHHHHHVLLSNQTEEEPSFHEKEYHSLVSPTATTVCRNLEECIEEFKSLPSIRYNPLENMTCIKEEPMRSPISLSEPLGYTFQLSNPTNRSDPGDAKLTEECDTDMDREVEPLDLYVEPNTDNDYLHWLAGQDTSSVVNFFDLPASQPGHW